MEWRSIRGQEGRYMVSTDGTVRSEISGKLLALRPDENGYPRAKLYNLLGGYSYVRVHRLVLEAFDGECPPCMQACHNNGDPSDNRLENLRWDTRSSNQLDRIDHGTSNRGSRNGQVKLTPADVVAIRERLANGQSQQSVADAFGVHRGTVQAINDRRTWSYL